MTEKEINRLADKIVEKLVGAQEKHDEQFKRELEEIKTLNPGFEIGTITQEELIKQELDSLKDLLKEQEENENYLQASKTLIKIEKFKSKYNL